MEYVSVRLQETSRF